MKRAILIVTCVLTISYYPLAQAEQKHWHVATPNGKFMDNGEIHLKCGIAPLSPIEMIKELRKNEISFTTNDNTDEKTGKVYMTIIEVKKLGKMFVYFRTKEHCEKTNTIRREVAKISIDRYR